MSDLNEFQKKQEEITQEIKLIPSVKGYYPVIDGIINPDYYFNTKYAKYKILWILKEANYGSGNSDSNKSYENLLCFYRTATESKIKKSPTTKRVLLASHRILSDIEPLKVFQSIAYINIKKIAGDSESDYAEIQNAYNKHKDLLLKQIKTYNPDIIICGSTLHYFENDLNFREGESKPIGMGNRHYFCLKDRLYINAYHPGFRPGFQKITENEYCDKIFEAFSYWISKK